MTAGMHYAIPIELLKYTNSTLDSMISLYLDFHLNLDWKLWLWKTIRFRGSYGVANVRVDFAQGLPIPNENQEFGIVMCIYEGAL